MPAMSALTVLATLLVSSLGAPLSVEPPEEAFPPAGYLEKSMAATLAMAKEMEKKEPRLGLAEGSSVYSAHLAPGAEISLTHGASKDQVFMVIAAPDDPKLDINLTITDKKDKELAKDHDESSGCMAAFKAADSEGFAFSLVNEGKEDAFVTVVLMNHGGHSKSLAKAGEAIASLMTAVRSVSILDENMSFASDGEWCLYGGFLKKQTSFTVGGLNLTAPVSLLMGACDEGSQDIDILLVDKDDKPLASDEEDDNRPIAEFKKQVEGAQATLGNSGNDAFCVMAVIDATK